MSFAPVPGLQCRRATRGDLSRLVTLLADDDLGRTREARADDPAYEQAFAAIDGDRNQLLLVGALDGEVLAMLHLTFIPGLSRRGAWRANIESVRVAAARRELGIGGWLIGRAMQAARERGCRLAQLASDKRRSEAHRFYSRLGFVASHEGFKCELEGIA